MARSATSSSPLEKAGSALDLEHYQKANSWDGSGFGKSTQLSLMAGPTPPRLARSAFKSAIWPNGRRTKSRGSGARWSGWFSSRSTCRLSSVSTPDYTPPRARRALILLKLPATCNSWLSESHNKDEYSPRLGLAESTTYGFLHRKLHAPFGAPPGMKRGGSRRTTALSANEVVT